MGVEFSYEGRSVPFEPGQTVLEALEHVGIPLSSSCRAGVCQSCVVRLVEGPLPRGAQDGLSDALKRSGHFLACIARPEGAIACVPANVAPFRGSVEIADVCVIGPDVVRVRLLRPESFAFSSGQFVTLRKDADLARSYSIVSRADEPEFFDVHVRRVPGGRMSTWFHNEARSGDVLGAEGPKGECVYQEGTAEEPLCLIGTGTGIGPLYAIVDDALRRGHRGPITIFHGALMEDRFYWVEELRELTERAPNVRYARIVRSSPASDGVIVGNLKDVVLSDASVWKGGRAFLCGDPALVRDLKKSLFLQGLSLKKIHSDPFVGTE